MLLRDHLLGVPDPAHALKRYPVPNSAATLGIGLLALVLPWALAAKVWLCTQLAFSFYALRHLARTVGASGAVWLIAPQAVLLNVNLWYGFVNFQLGLAWVLLLAAMLLERLEAGERAIWPVGLVLVLAFFTHMIPFTFCLLLVGLHALQTGRGRLLWQTLPGLALTVWYVIGRFGSANDADGATGMASSVASFSAAFWEFKANAYLKSFGLVNPWGAGADLFGEPGFLLLFALNALLALTVGVLIVLVVGRGLARRHARRFLWMAVVVCLPVALLLPGATLGISDPGARVLQTALALAIVLAVDGGPRWVSWCASASALVLTGCALWLFSYAGFGRELPVYHGRLRPEIAQLDHVPNRDQIYFYGALTRGEMSLRIFPTGMFLNR